MRYALSLSIAVMALAVDPSAAHAQLGIGYAVGVGTVLPVSAELSDVVNAGIHIEGGVYFKVLPGFAVGPHITYDTTFGKDIGTTQHTGDFTGLSARALYAGDAGRLGRWWGSVGLGYYIGKLSPSPTSTRPNDEKHLGLDVHAGFAFRTTKHLGIGPAIGVIYPNFNKFKDWILVTAGIRGHWTL